MRPRQVARARPAGGGSRWPGAARYRSFQAVQRHLRTPDRRPGAAPRRDDPKYNIKGKDLAARYGGEEFVAILPDTDLGALIVAENIRKAIQAKELLKRSTNEKLGRITASFGVALFRPNDTVSSFIERADRCLYAAKHAGRNRVTSETDPEVVSFSATKVA